MLKVTKNINITGTSVINGEVVCGWQATLDENQPQAMSINGWKNNEMLYKENREQCRSEQVEFEELVYALQDELIAKVVEE